jgi:hypothetical protein
LLPSRLDATAFGGLVTKLNQQQQLVLHSFFIIDLFGTMTTMAGMAFGETPERVLKRVQQLEDVELPSLPSFSHDLDYDSASEVDQTEDERSFEQQEQSLDQEEQSVDQAETHEVVSIL